VSSMVVVVVEEEGIDGHRRFRSSHSGAIPSL